MKCALPLVMMGAICGAVIVAAPGVAAHLRGVLRNEPVGQGMAGSTRAHTEERFSFIANAPMERVAPLFGAEGERMWAPDWDPQFVYPMPAVDQEGMVFTVAHERGKSVWVNTEFDAKNGRIQYVYVIPDIMVTLITLRLTPGGKQTRVEVKYDRTSLSPESDAHVRQTAEQHHKGTDWEREVNGYLGKENRN